MELIDLTNVRQVLEDFAKDMKENYKEHLEWHNRMTQERKLIDSVETEVVVGDRSFRVEMELNEYWKYVENDTKPHFPPPSAILKWVQIKPVIPRPFDNGKIPTPQQLAFLIGRKIAREGTEGSHDYEKTFEGVYAWYEEKIAEALAKDMTKVIKRLVVEG